MENWLSWFIPTAVVLIGIVAKFLLEIYLPEFKKDNINLKRTGISALMTVLLLFLFGMTAFSIYTEPWSRELEIYTLFQAFLFIFFLAFLLIMRIFRIFMHDTEDDTALKGQSGKESQIKVLMQ